MWRGFLSLLKKDFKLMLSSKFFLLMFGSLILYSCYINFIYVGLEQDIYPVYLYDPLSVHGTASSEMIRVDSLGELQIKSGDGYAVGIDISSGTPEISMVSSGIGSTDQYRAAYSLSLLTPSSKATAEVIGIDNKEMKSRREITCEFLFFELAAVGFSGLASMLFKEKQMGIIRVHGVLPVSKTAFILSKLILFLLSDLVFSILLTTINLGVSEALSVLPYVLLQTGILSLIMALVGFFCAILLPDFKQFSLLYLVLAVFITTPVFLAGQTGISWSWIKYHPMYHLFMAMKNAYQSIPSANGIYCESCASTVCDGHSARLLSCMVLPGEPGMGVYCESCASTVCDGHTARQLLCMVLPGEPGMGVYYAICGLSVVLLFLLVHRTLIREMAKEG